MKTAKSVFHAKDLQQLKVLFNGTVFIMPTIAIATFLQN